MSSVTDFRVNIGLKSMQTLAPKETKHYEDLAREESHSLPEYFLLLYILRTLYE